MNLQFTPLIYTYGKRSPKDNTGLIICLPFIGIRPYMIEMLRARALEAKMNRTSWKNENCDGEAATCDCPLLSLPFAILSASTFNAPSPYSSKFQGMICTLIERFILYRSGSQNIDFPNIDTIADCSKSADIYYDCKNLIVVYQNNACGSGTAHVLYDSYCSLFLATVIVPHGRYSSLSCIWHVELTSNFLT